MNAIQLTDFRNRLLQELSTAAASFRRQRQEIETDDDLSPDFYRIRRPGQ
jgi:hypothetical protein